MNDNLEHLMYQAGLTAQGCWDEMDDYNRQAIELFAKLIIKKCGELNKTQSYDLLGVLVDTEDGDGFDDVCLNTVKRVHSYLGANTLEKYFGVEE